MGRLSYSSTNESLDAVNAGLQPCGDDRILSVASSGCAAFSFLAEGAHVEVFDRDPIQLGYVQTRKMHLINGDFRSFLNVISTDIGTSRYRIIKSKHYFRKKNRLRRIQNNIENLSILHDPLNVFYDLPSDTFGTFSKIYFSNILFMEGYHGDSSTNVLRRLSRLLKDNGLVYLALPVPLRRLEDFPHLYPGGPIPKEFCVDAELTEKASVYERQMTKADLTLDWNPLVLVKV